MLRQYFKHFLFSKSFLINCQTWRHIINLWQNVLGSFGEWKRISFQPETKNDFSKPTSLSFSLKLFVETANHKAIYRSQQFLLKASQLANIKTQFPKWHWWYSFFWPANKCCLKFLSVFASGMVVGHNKYIFDSVGVSSGKESLNEFDCKMAKAIPHRGILTCKIITKNRYFALQLWVHQIIWVYSIAPACSSSLY